MTTEGSSVELAITEVGDANRQLWVAIADDDFDALELLLGNELFYRHATGRSNDKAEYLAELRAMKRSVEADKLDIRIYGNGEVAAVIGGYATTVSPRDGSKEPRRVDHDALQVWAKRDGSWQLVAHEATPR